MSSTRIPRDRSPAVRPVLYQLCRAGERFEVGDGPLDLSTLHTLVLGRGTEEDRRHGFAPVDDPWMSSRHARLFRDDGVWHIEDLESTNGVLVEGELVGRSLLPSGSIIETGRTFWFFQEEPADVPLPVEPKELGTWATWSPNLASDLARLEETAAQGTHILVAGPEGSGKGFLARTVHLLSGRAGRLVHLDCRERRPARLEVDLFGGGNRVARLRQADLGTLFLENVHALPRELQARLVDTLRNGGFVPEGKTRRVSCDVRVIASSTVDAEHGLRERTFKRRFVETVGQVQITLPGLKGRRPDLGLLLDDVLARAKGAPALSRDACRAVLLATADLNVKALTRVVESAAVLAGSRSDDGARSGRVELGHLPIAILNAEARSQLLGTEESPREERVPEHIPPPPTEEPAGAGAPAGAGPPPIPAGELYLDSADAFDLDPEATDFHAESLPGRGGSDPERTSEVAFDVVAAQAHAYEQAAEGFELGDPLHYPEQNQAFPEDDPLDATDPLQPRPPKAHRPPTRPATRGRSSEPAVRPRSSTSWQPPELPSVERSYANAIDPDLIVEALTRSHGNVSAAARYLGKPRALILKWIREFGIEPDQFR